jgi:hypothetical protein
MTAATLLQPLCFREFDNNGGPLGFGTVTSYQAGTNTQVATYTDSTAAAPNLNPLTLNNRGEAAIYVLPNVNYKFVVKDQFGNQIRVTDNVQQSQLITLYGGVDTGAANAYVLNFTAAFNSYVDGTVIYWIPSNSNTGPVTINVNGLGVVNILNQGGTALTAQQIFANQIAVIMYRGGSFYLISSGQSSSAAQTLFLANRSTSAGAQTLANNAATVVVFDTASINRGTNYNVATGVFTAAIAGIYTFTATLELNLGANAGNILIPLSYFSKNNTIGPGNLWKLTGQMPGALPSGFANAAAAIGEFGGTANFSMNAGDTMQVSVQTGNPGGGYTASGTGTDCQFSGYQSG